MDASLNRGGKVGRFVLMLVSALVVLNGVGWFFVGPTLSTFEQDTGVSVVEFSAAYPSAAHLLSLQARNTAILIMGIGLLGLGRLFPNHADTSTAVRLSGWAFGVTLAGVGFSELAAGAAFGLAYLGLGVLALIGQALYRR